MSIRDYALLQMRELPADLNVFTREVDQMLEKQSGLARLEMQLRQIDPD